VKGKDTEEISLVEYQPVYPLVNNKLTSLDVSNIVVYQLIMHETISYTTKPELILTRPQ
jgi:hypothetical protein